MRNAFIHTLCDLAAEHSDVFLLCGDLGYSVLEQFADRFPDRFLNTGISEQNMTEVAAGLSLEGYNVFTYSIGNFPTLRCMEQVRYDVCYHDANVKLVAVGGGYAYGPQGVSHHTTEDIAMLRAIPNMMVCAPADPIEAGAAAEFMVRRHGPGYVRLNKAGEPCIHDPQQPLHLVPGKFIEVLTGRNTALLGNGAILAPVLDEIRRENMGWAAYSAPVVGNYEPSELKHLAHQFQEIVTVEEHQLNGGFGSSIVEAFSDMYARAEIDHMPRIRRIAIPNQFVGMSGNQSYLRQMAGLSVLRHGS